MRDGMSAGLSAALPLSGRAVMLPTGSIKTYIYPGLYRYQDGRVLNSPQTVRVVQATTEVPQSDRLTGVAVIIYWSDVEPAPGRYDFSVVQAILDFWKQRDKKVILDIATIGYPVRAASGAGIQSATPQWLLDRTVTYIYPSQIMGLPERGTLPAVFPDFRDSGFQSAIKRLAQATSRLDGHAGLAQLRIPVGLMGEDNPLVGPVIHPLPWYTESLWLAYCRSVFQIYRAVFHRTQLEFDIGRLAWMFARGNATDQMAVTNFIDDLFDRGVLLAFNGLTGTAEPQLTRSEPSLSGITQGLEFLKAYSRKGGATGLEAAGPLAAAKMANIAEIARTIREVAPTRVLLFNDFIGGVAPESPQWGAYKRAYGANLSAQVEENARALARLM